MQKVSGLSVLNFSQVIGQSMFFFTETGGEREGGRSGENKNSKRGRGERRQASGKDNGEKEGRESLKTGGGGGERRGVQQPDPVGL